MDKTFTAYCGLCCRDCIPSNEEFFASVKRLRQTLAELQFSEYARLKSEKNPFFSGYPVLPELLREIEALQCPAPCREGGGKPECETRSCAKERKHEGCWECAGRSQCVLLEPLRRIHPNLDYHLELIERFGPDAWFERRKAHYRWQRETAAPEKGE